MSKNRTHNYAEPLSSPSTSSHVYEGSEKLSKKSERDLSTEKSRIIRERSRSLSRIRNTMKSVYAQLKLSKNSDLLHLVVILGVSNDLAKKKTYPALWNLYKNGLLPPNIRFFGFARTPMTTDELRENCSKYMHVLPEDEHKYEEFWKLSNYFIGSYIAKMDYEVFNKELSNFGTINNYSNRLFYIALPNVALEHITPYLKIIAHVHHNANTGSKGWTRVMVEKPFGRDTESCTKISEHLLSIFREDEIYRIDHYLGKQVIQNILTVRFANFLLSSTWNRNYIQAVLITLKETHNVRFNNKYFDNYGIIRDIMQNHMLQFLSLVAMEKPLSTQPNDIRDEKVKVLKCIPPVKIDDVVLGQYCGNPRVFEGDERQIGYHDEPEIPKNSLTPTFCTAVLKIKNERWDGVPFILKCGKAMNEKSTQIRIQYKDTPGQIFEGKLERNELVIQIEPTEGIYLKAMTKTPCISFSIEEKDLILGHCYKKTHQVFERLILDVFCGSQMHFIRSDEILQASRIFTPLLYQVENDKIKPLIYINGTDGPREAAELIRKNKFIVYD